MTNEMLVVDLGGVAARYLPEQRLTALQYSTGIDADTLRARLFESGLDSRAERGEYTTDQLVEQILTWLDHTIDVDELVGAWSQCFEPAVQVLNALDQHGGPAALFTNNGPIVDLCLAGPLRHLADRFETIICSWHLGTVKPEVAAFHRAATRLKLQPPSLILLDDNPSNVAAARRAGWRAAHVTTTTSLIESIASAH